MRNYFEFTKAKHFITKHDILQCEKKKIITWHFKFKEEVKEHSYQSTILFSTTSNIQSWEFSQDSSSHSTSKK